MSATQVQSVVATGAAVTSQQVTLSGVTAGNCLVLMVGYADQLQLSSATPAAPTDSNGTVLTASNPASQFNVEAGGVGIFFVQNCNSGTHTFTVNPFNHIAALFCQLSLTEWSGIAASAFDVASSNGSNIANNSTTGNSGTTATLAQQSELDMAIVCIDTGTGLANSNISDPPTTGFTSIFVRRDTTINVGAEGAFKEANSTTGQIATWTWSQDSTQFFWQAALATFKELIAITTVVGSLALTGAAPSVTTAFASSPTTASLVITGGAASTGQISTISPTVGSLSISSAAASSVVSIISSPSAGSLSMTGIASSVVTFSTISPISGTLTFDGLPPVRAAFFVPDTGQLVFTGSSQSRGTRGVSNNTVQGNSGGVQGNSGAVENHSVEG